VATELLEGRAPEGATVYVGATVQGPRSHARGPHHARLGGRTLRSLILIVGLALSSGCVTHRIVELDPPSQAAIADLGVEASGRSVLLHLDTASAQEAIGLRLRPDSVRWTTEAGARRAVHPGALRRIEIRNRPRGLVDGLLAGAGIAVLAGAVAGACCENAPEAWVPIGYAVGIGVGLVTVPLGGIIGFLRGHRTVYEAR